MRRGTKTVKNQAEKILQTVTEYMLKEPKATSWSATMPPYCYTELCPDPKYRSRP